MPQKFEQVGPATSQSPFHHVNQQGLSLRLQIMLRVRDGDGNIALVQTESHQPGRWWIPAETLRPNEEVTEGAVRVSETWFGEDLDPEIADVLTFPADTDAGETAWYIVHVFEAEAPDRELDALPGGCEVHWTAPGDQPPGPFAMDHAAVWPLLS